MHRRAEKNNGFLPIASHLRFNSFERGLTGKIEKEILTKELIGSDRIQRGTVCQEVRGSIDVRTALCAQRKTANKKSFLRDGTPRGDLQGRIPVGPIGKRHKGRVEGFCQVDDGSFALLLFQTAPSFVVLRKTRMNASRIMPYYILRKASRRPLVPGWRSANRWSSRTWL